MNFGINIYITHDRNKMKKKRTKNDIDENKKHCNWFIFRAKCF